MFNLLMRLPLILTLIGLAFWLSDSNKCLGQTVTSNISSSTGGVGVTIYYCTGTGTGTVTFPANAISGYAEITITRIVPNGANVLLYSSNYSGHGAMPMTTGRLQIRDSYAYPVPAGGEDYIVRIKKYWTYSQQSEV